MCQMSHVRQLLQIQIDTAGGLNQIFHSYRKFEDDFSIIHLFFCLFKVYIQKIDSKMKGKLIFLTKAYCTT